MAKTVLADQDHEIYCGDRFGNDFLVGTSQGLYFYDGASLREIKLDKRRKVTKINVVEPLGIVITICSMSPCSPWLCVPSLFSLPFSNQLAFREATRTWWSLRSSPSARTSRATPR